MAAHDRGRSGQFIRSEQQAETDTRAVRLRAQGMSFAAIGKALGYADESGARKAVQRALAAIPAPDVEELRALQSEELDALRRGLWQVIHGTHYRVSNSGRVVMDPATNEPLLDPAPKISAANALARVLDRQAKLFGLDAPARAQVEAVVTIEAIDAEIDRLNAEIARQEREQRERSAEMERREVEHRRPPQWLPDLYD